MGKETGMARYIIKRILWIIPILLGVITIVFFISALTPGDPAASLLGSTATQEEIEAMHHTLGLDQPLIKRWFDYIVGIFTRLDFGTSYVTRQPVIKEILVYFPVTIKLALAATLLGVVLGIPLGVISSLKQYTWIDSAILVLSVLFISLPNFWLAMMLLKVFAVNLNWLPSFGLDRPSGWILPIICAGLQSMTQNIRITRSSMLEVMRQDYIRTARAKGQREGTIVTRHMLRNAMIPVATSIGSGLGNQLGGNMALESVFALPGLGNYIVKAITAINTPAMLGGILFVAIMFTLVNLCVDISYVLIDPRLKTRVTGRKLSKKAIKRMLTEQGAG
jgi:peptide/nickel transport system permease protein